jgi:hypothetical protein
MGSLICHSVHFQPEPPWSPHPSRKSVRAPVLARGAIKTEPIFAAISGISGRQPGRRSRMHTCRHGIRFLNASSSKQQRQEQQHRKGREVLSKGGSGGKCAAGAPFSSSSVQQGHDRRGQRRRHPCVGGNKERGEHSVLHHNDASPFNFWLFRAH